MSKFNKVLFSSISGKWRTPHDLFLELDKEFKFNLDPCNPPISKDFFPLKNGLTQDWPGGNTSHTTFDFPDNWDEADYITKYSDKCRAFLNPDYKKIDRWIEKAWVEICEGRCEIAVFLVPNRSDTDWFHFAIKRTRDPIRCIKRRLRFSGHKNGAPFPSIILILRTPKKKG